MAKQSNFIPTRGAQPMDIRQDGFLGVDYKREISQLPQRYRLADAENMIFPGGLAKRCGGCTQLGDSISGTSGASATSGSAQVIRGLHQYRTLSDNTNTMLSYAVGVMYKLSSGSWVEAGKSDIIHTNNNDMEMINANDYLYAVNGDEYHLRYDGTSWVEQTTKPVGTMVVEWKDRLWWAGNETYPSRLYFSDLGDYDTYTGSNYIDFKPNNGEKIQALGVAYDMLVIFKETTKGFYNGTSIAEYPIDGAVSQKSVGSYNRRLFYPSKDNIYELNGMEAMPIGEPMKPLWDGETVNGRVGVSTARHDQAAGIVYDGRYYLSVAKSGQSVNNEIWVYDIDEGWWAPWHDADGNYFKIHRWATYVDSVGAEHLVGGSDTGEVWIMNTGQNWDNDGTDTAIPAYMLTGKFTGDTPHKKKRCMRALAKGQATGTNRMVQFSYKREQDASPTGIFKQLCGVAAYNYDAGHQYDTGLEYATQQEGMMSVIVPGKWRGVQLRVLYNEASADFYINNITLHRVRADRFAFA